MVNSSIKILELYWPFCWYRKEITDRTLRLKHSEHCEACTDDNKQVTLLTNCSCVLLATEFINNF